MCADIRYGYTNRNATRPTWRSNLLAQKLCLNTFELSGTLRYSGTAIHMGVATKEDFGFSSFPRMELPPGPEYGDDEAHHNFVEEMATEIACGTSPISRGLAGMVSGLGREARELFGAIYPAWGSKYHHVRGVAEALHWATDTRDPMNSAQDYTRNRGHGLDGTTAWGITLVFPAAVSRVSRKVSTKIFTTEPKRRPYGCSTTRA